MQTQQQTAVESLMDSERPVMSEGEKAVIRSFDRALEIVKELNQIAQAKANLGIDGYLEGKR